MAQPDKSARQSANIEKLQACDDLRRALARALAAGASWPEIIRVIAEKGPLQWPEMPPEKPGH
jgi:hypothetical protein